MSFFVFNWIDKLFNKLKQRWYVFLNVRGGNLYIDKKNPPKEIPSKLYAVCHGCGQQAYWCPNGCKNAPCDHGFFGCIIHPLDCGPVEYIKEEK